MKLKTFQGRTMAEALEQVKRELGREAVILNTRSLRRGGLLGLGARHWVEITAAPNDEIYPYLRKRGKARPLGLEPVSTRELDRPLQGNAVLTEIAALKSLVGELVKDSRRTKSAAVPNALYETYLTLIQNSVGEALADQLIEQVRQELPADACSDPERVRSCLLRRLEPMLPTTGPVNLVRPDGPTIIALVGPTGVGKTTTIAKLAANCCLRDHLKVGLITIDTYRIAAVEQLRTYAQIMGVPFEVVTSPPHLAETVVRLKNCNVVLMDTAGRGQRDVMKIKELGGFFAAVRPHEIHLVLSSTSSEVVLHEAIERFSCVGINRVIFTKLDEALGFGAILSSLEKLGGTPLSYVTTGQDVPDDIEFGEGKKLANLILQGFPVGSSNLSPVPYDEAGNRK